MHFDQLNLAGDTLAQTVLHVDLGAFDKADLTANWNQADGGAFTRWRWEDAAGAVIDAGDFLNIRPSQLHWPEARIRCTLQDGSVQLTTDSIAYGVRLTMDGAHFMTNGFTLFPGEERTVEFQPLNASPVDLSTLKVEYFGEFQRTD